MKEQIKTNNAPKAIGPYSQGIISNGLVFVSGQIPINPYTNEVIDGDVKEQTRQVMDNLGGILKEAGSSFNSIVKTTIYIKNMNDFNVVNEVYSSYLKEPYPARATVEVSCLPKNVLVEIDCIANLE